MFTLAASPAPVKLSTAAEWPAWTDEVVFWPTDGNTPAPEDDALDLHPTIDDFGTDGDYLDEPTGPDDEDARWAAENLASETNPGWAEGEPDGSAIELYTVSAWGRHLDDLADASAALDAQERGLIFA